MLDLNYCGLTLALFTGNALSEGVKEHLSSLAEEMMDLASRIPHSSGQPENWQRLGFRQPVSTSAVG